MKRDKIIWGLIFVFIGAILLLENFNVIEFQWMAIWKFWPLALILIGANMLLIKSAGRNANIITVILTVGALAFIGWKGVVSEPQGIDDWILRSGPVKGNLKKNVYSEEYKGLRYASLKISGGGTVYKLKDTTADLFKAIVSGALNNYGLKRGASDSSEYLTFKMAGNGTTEDGKLANNVILSINKQPIWDMDIESGASKAHFDLSQFKIRSLRFEGGASSMDLKMGRAFETSKINIETGASKIVLHFPRGEACRIKMSAGLTSTSMPGFKAVGEDTYETENYASAQNKYEVQFEGALSSFKVSWF